MVFDSAIHTRSYSFIECLTTRTGITTYAANRITQEPSSVFDLISDNSIMITIIQ